MVGLVLLLAFFLASAPVRNSDFWLHLATGKALLDGHYQLGADPFSYAADGSTWVNHSWLFDVVLYGLYQLLGGTGLAILKALLVAGLAAVLVRTGAGKSLWLGALGAILALETMTPWLTLRPSCLSLLFLALTIFFLEKPVWKPWTFFVLFAFWVNLADWFILGPITVGFYALGGLLQGSLKRSASFAPGSSSIAPRALGLVLLAGLAGCLINPHHVQAFQLPPPLGSDVTAVLQNDPDLGNQFQQLLFPYRGAYFSSSFFSSATGIAYWSLVVLGTLSFGLNGAGFRWQRGLTWVGFFLASILWSQLVPFFAVVAGPILALNLGQIRARIFRSETGAWQTLGRLGLFAGCLILAVAAWAGWLQRGLTGLPGPRRWTVEAEPSLERAAKQLARWHKEGKLQGQDFGFNLTPESANTFAWFCPEEKGFLDGHWNLSSKAAADFVAIRKGLLASGDQNPDEEMRALLRHWHINHVVVYNNNQRLTYQVMSHLLVRPQEWPLLYLGGRVAIFGWRDPAAGARALAVPPLDLAKEAFAAAADPPASVPETGGEPGPYRWWHALWRPPVIRSADGDEAQMALKLFEILHRSSFMEQQKSWSNSVLAGMVSGGGGPGFPGLDIITRVHTDPSCREAFFLSKDQGPPASLYLAIRAARRALAANPRDVQSQLALARAYMDLGSGTRQRGWLPSFPLLKSMRGVQIIAAYNQALKLQPGLVEAHSKLADIYRGLGYYDLALDHFKQFVGLTRKAGPPAGADLTKFADSLTLMEDQIQQQEKAIQKARDQVDLQSGNLKVAVAAKLALDKGLAGRALQILLASDVAAFGVQGMEMQLQLLLTTGNLDRARACMPADPEQKKLQLKDLGTFKYYWIKAQLAGAGGDHDQADRDLEAMMPFITFPKKELPLRSAAAGFLAYAILAGSNDGLFQRIPNLILRMAPDKNLSYHFLHYPDPQTALLQSYSLAGEMNQEAIIKVERGLLALEAGRSQQSRQHFQDAMDFWNSPTGRLIVFGEAATGRAIARFYLDHLAKIIR